MFQPEGEFESGDRQHAFVRLMDSHTLKPTPRSKARTRSQTRSQPRDPETRILISLPTYPLLWQPCKHTSQPPYRPGSDPRSVYWLDTDSVSNFFSKKYMQPWLDGANDLQRARHGYQPKPNSIPFMPQLSFTALSTRTMYPYWYGPGIEYRSAYYREVPWRAYDLFLRRVVRAGRRAFEDADDDDRLDASTIMASWGFDWISVYRDSSDTSPRKVMTSSTPTSAGVRSGSGRGSRSGHGSGSGGTKPPATPTIQDTNAGWFAAKTLQREQEHGGNLRYEDEYGLGSGSDSVQAGRELGAPASPDLSSNVHSPQRSPETKGNKAKARKAQVSKTKISSKATLEKKKRKNRQAPKGRKQADATQEQNQRYQGAQSVQGRKRSRSNSTTHDSPNATKIRKGDAGDVMQRVMQKIKHEDDGEDGDVVGPKAKRRRLVLLDSHGHGFVLARPPLRGGWKGEGERAR